MTKNQKWHDKLLYLHIQLSLLMKKNSLVIWVIIHVLFAVGIIVVFGRFCYLRPGAYGAFYKEYITGAIAVAMLYLNYLILIPQLFLRRRFLLFWFLAMASVFLSVGAEYLLVKDNVLSLIRHSINDPSQIKDIMLFDFAFVFLRNLGLFCFFFILKMLEYSRMENKDIQKAISKMEGALLVKDENHNDYFVKLNQIIYVCQDQNYAFIYTDEQKFHKKCSLSTIEELIDSKAFIRISRNCVINAAKIESYDGRAVTMRHSENGSICFVVSDYAKEKIQNLAYREKIYRTFLSTEGSPMPQTGSETENGTINSDLALQIDHSDNKKEDFGTINLADLEEFSEIFAEDEDYKTIILHIAELGPVSAVDLSELLNIPLRTVARKIKLLKEKGVVEFAGAKKNGGYVLKKQ